MRIHALILGPFIFGISLLASELSTRNNRRVPTGKVVLSVARQRW
jgi:hypothetical protein